MAGSPMGREDLKEEVKETFCGEERQSGVGARQRVSEEATQRDFWLASSRKLGKEGDSEGREGFTGGDARRRE
jgi:hypothetical protein